MKEYFNFLKFHVMSHYVDFIRRYETANEYDTSHDKTRHKYMIKTSYEKTNKWENFQKQLLWHNDRRLNVLIMKNILLHIRIRRQNMSKSRTKFINTRAIRDSLNLNSLDNDRLIAVTYQSRFSNMNARYWYFVENLAMTMTYSKLISTLTTFIREKRRTIMTDNVFDKYCRNRDFFWTKQCQISIHSSLTC